MGYKQKNIYKSPGLQVSGIERNQNTDLSCGPNECVQKTPSPTNQQQALGKNSFSQSRPSTSDINLFRCKNVADSSVGGPRASMVLVDRMIPSTSYMNHGDVFIMEATDSKTVWVWIGLTSGQYEIKKALYLARNICTDFLGSSLCILDAETMDKWDISHGFWERLSVTSELEARKTISQIKDAAQVSDQQALDWRIDEAKVYKFKEDEDDRLEIYIVSAGDPLYKGVLDSTSCLLIDLTNNPSIYIWAGIYSSHESRSWSLLKAEEIINRCLVDEQFERTLSWNMDGAETWEFREMFFDWMDTQWIEEDNRNNKSKKSKRQKRKQLDSRYHHSHESKNYQPPKESKVDSHSSVENVDRIHDWKQKQRGNDNTIMSSYSDLIGETIAPEMKAAPVKGAVLPLVISSEHPRKEVLETTQEEEIGDENISDKEMTEVSGGEALVIDLIKVDLQDREELGEKESGDATKEFGVNSELARYLAEKEQLEIELKREMDARAAVEEKLAKTYPRRVKEEHVKGERTHEVSEKKNTMEEVSIQTVIANEIKPRKEQKASVAEEIARELAIKEALERELTELRSKKEAFEKKFAERAALDDAFKEQGVGRVVPTQAVGLGMFTEDAVSKEASVVKLTRSPAESGASDRDRIQNAAQEKGKLIETYNRREDVKELVLTSERDDMRNELVQCAGSVEREKESLGEVKPINDNTGDVSEGESKYIIARDDVITSKTGNKEKKKIGGVGTEVLSLEMPKVSKRSVSHERKDLNVDPGYVEDKARSRSLRGKKSIIHTNSAMEGQKVKHSHASYTSKICRSDDNIKGRTVPEGENIVQDQNGSSVISTNAVDVTAAPIDIELMPLPVVVSKQLELSDIYSPPPASCPTTLDLCYSLYLMRDAEHDLEKAISEFPPTTDSCGEQSLTSTLSQNDGEILNEQDFFLKSDVLDLPEVENRLLISHKRAKGPSGRQNASNIKGTAGVGSFTPTVPAQRVNIGGTYGLLRAVNADAALKERKKRGDVGDGTRSMAAKTSMSLGNDEVLSQKGECRLIHIKGRRKLIARRVPLSITSLNSGDVFILDDGHGVIYQWNGSHSNRIEKGKGLDLVKNLKDREHSGTARIIVLEQGKTDMDTMEFWSLLNVQDPTASSLADQIATAEEGGDDAEVEHLIREFSKLYKMVQTKNAQGRLVIEMELIASYGLKKEMLDINECYLLDCTNEMYLWCGKNSDIKVRRKALEKVIELKSSRSPTWCAPISREFSDGESVLFREKFSNWTFGPPIQLQKLVTGKNVALKKAEEKIPLQDIYSNPAIREEVMVDSGHNGQVHVWRIVEFTKSPVPVSRYGHFYSGDSYIVLYKYHVGNRESFLVYYWQGRTSTINEKGTSAMLTVELDKEFKLDGLAKEVRVVQNQESRHFLAVFHDNYIVHQGKAHRDLESPPKMVSKAKLYEVCGSSAEYTRVIEVDPIKPSFKSHCCFILVPLHHRTIMWQGKYASNWIIDYANKAAVILSQYYRSKKSHNVIQEGHEPSKFWHRGIGHLDKKYHAINDPSLANSNRLFHMSEATGQFNIHEIPPPFSREDMSRNGCFMLDAYNMIYIWTQQSSASEKKKSVETAFSYLELAQVDRPKFAKTLDVFLVQFGSEPLAFTSCFMGWIPLPNGNQELESGRTFLSQYTKTYSYEELKARQFAKGIDTTCLEKYLDDKVFEQVFEMSREAFANLPTWQAQRIKQTKGLF